MTTSSSTERLRPLAFAIVATTLWQPSALAQSSWGRWESFAPVPMGPATRMEVGANFDGRPTVFVISNDGSLYRSSQMDSAPNSGIEQWTPWEGSRPPGSTTLVRSFVAQDGIGDGRIGVGVNQDSRLEVFAPGSDGRLWHSWQATPGGAWSDWSAFDNPPNVPWRVEDIRVASNQDGTMDVLVLNGVNSELYHQSQDVPNGAWSGRWEHLADPPNSTVHAPIVARNLFTGSLEMLALGADHKVWVQPQLTPNGYWGDWQATQVNKATPLDALISVVPGQSGEASVFARTLTSLWVASQDSTGRWAGEWDDLGAPAGFLASPIDALRFGDGRVGAFVAVVNSGLFAISFDRSRKRWASLAKWQSVNADWGVLQPLRGLVAAQTIEHRAEVFVIGRNNLIWRTSEIDPPDVVAPPPRAAAAPATILELANGPNAGPFQNPQQVPSASAVDGKPICSNDTFLSGYNPGYEWTPIIPGSQMPPEVGISGWAFNAHSSGEDFWFTHPFGNDVNYDVAPDAPYGGLIAARRDSDGDRDRAVRIANTYYGMGISDALHVETEQDFVPAGPEYEVHDGDRVAVFGRWIIDCGHGDYHSEIHPPLMTTIARAMSPDVTHSAIYGRRFLVSQEFGDGAMYEHLMKELAKAGLIPLYQMGAIPEVFSTPFGSTQVVDYILRPPSPRRSPGDQLWVTFGIETRPGISVTLFQFGTDGIRVHVVFDASKYVPLAVPFYTTGDVPFDDLYNEVKSHSAGAAEGIQTLRTLGGLNMSLSLERGIETHRYVPPMAASLPATSAAASTLFGTPFASTASAQWPIRGVVNVHWKRNATAAVVSFVNPPPAANSTVAASTLWVDSGIALRQGEHFRISAKGNWSNRGPPSVGPKGFQNFKFAGTLLATGDLASLIAKVNNDIFYVGEGVDGYSPSDGELYLSINDTPDTFGDNEGSVQAQIWVR